MKNMEDRKDRALSYERPGITDYGTLRDLTLQGDQPNADQPSGNDNTAYSVG